MRLAAALGLVLLAWPALAQEEDETARPGLIPVDGLVLFYNSQGPLSFVAATPKELPPGAVPIGEVRARSCQYSLSIPLSASLTATSLAGAAGNGSYRKALAALKGEHPELRGIYDVKTDYHTIAVLTIFRRQCTEVLARGFK